MTWEMWVGLALVAAGVWAAWLRVKRRRQGAVMGGWSRVDGRVESHDIVETSTTDSDNRVDYGYEPRLSYSYTAGGSARTGTRASLDTVSFANRKLAQAWLDARPVGSAIAVHVNPANQDDALLDTAVKNDWWVPLFFIALGIAVALGLFG